MNPFSNEAATTQATSSALGQPWEHQGDLRDPSEEGSSQGHIASRRTYRRPRAGRACGTCHSRRVRCDAGSRGIPCTNCEAFSLECSIPPKKNKKREGDTANNLKRAAQRGGTSRGKQKDDMLVATTESESHDFASLILQADEHIKQQPLVGPQYATLIKQEVAESQIDDPGRVAYLQEFSNLSLLVHDYDEPEAAGVHYPLPKFDDESTEITTKMNQVELQILEKRGALSLPPKDLCDELIHAYFKWVAPIVPMVNQHRFMESYRDPHNPPSILLMQAILLAGSRVCTIEMLMDSNGSPIPAATLFYKRAKALYDADYEQDRVTIVQALILMGWYWEEPGKVTKNVFYWNGLASTIAHGFGMHRNPKNSKLSHADQKLWKRIWWTLFTRDRSVAVALGRPPHINMRDSDMEMVTYEDFIEDEKSPPNLLHTLFFLQYVEICKIMDLVLLQNYSISARARKQNTLALRQCDIALAEWERNCPIEIRWDPYRYNFWTAYLHCMFQTTICLLHRAHLPPAPMPAMFASLGQSPAFQSAHRITSLVESLVAHQELRYAPPFMIYSLLSTLIVQIYQLYIAVPAPAEDQIRRISVCMDALENVSEIWLVAKAVQDLFETVLSSAGYEKSLDAPGGSTYRKRVGAIGSGFKTPANREVKIEETGQPADGKSPTIKKMPLTPALRIWREAALESSVTPKVSKIQTEAHDMSSNSSSMGSQIIPEPPQVFLDEWKDGPQTTFVNDPTMVGQYNNFDPSAFNYFPDDQNIIWDSQWADGNIPAPTGFNPAEWFQFFGIR